MSLILVLKENHLNARKAKDSFRMGVYENLLSAIDNSRIDVNDNELVIAQVKKVIKSINKALDKFNETIENVILSDESKAKVDSNIRSNKMEIDELSQFVPKELTADEIRVIVGDVTFEDTSFVNVKNTLVEKLNGEKYEMKDLIAIVKEIVK